MASAPAGAQDKTAQAWQALQDHINKWYYRFDFEALELGLAAVAGHYFVESDPIWLMIIGPSGSGKSTIINALQSLPLTRIIGDLTPKSLISHRSKYKGLLDDIGPSGIMLFKDFTTIISKRHDDKLEIASQLREVYDGYFSRASGMGRTATWKGKITAIAAVTPAVEQQWSLMRELGERFVMVRWGRAQGLEVAKMAGKQRGHEKQILETMQQLTKDLVRATELKPPPSLTDAMNEQIAQLAELTAVMRGSISRARQGAGEIMGVAAIELPTRLMKAMQYAVSSYAGLMRRDPSFDDVRLARRIACDSIPLLRVRIFDRIPVDHGISWPELFEATRMPKSSFDYHLSDLEALDVLTNEQSCTGMNWVQLTPAMQKLRKAALPLGGTLTGWAHGGRPDDAYEAPRESVS